MQVRSLGCDWCKEPRDAIATVRLVLEQSDGRRKKRGPQADVCEQHLRALGIIFAPRKRTRAGLLHRVVEVEKLIAAVERGRGLDNARHATPAARERARKQRTKKQRAQTQAIQDKRRPLWDAMHAEREAAVLAALRTADHRLKRPEIDKLAKLPVHMTGPLLRRLVGRGLVTMYSKGPHARYELASKARHGSEGDHAA